MIRSRNFYVNNPAKSSGSGIVSGVFPQLDVAGGHADGAQFHRGLDAVAVCDEARGDERGERREPGAAHIPADLLPQLCDDVAALGSTRLEAASTLDAATTERTMLLAEVYRRNGVWRLRAIGQGYDDGLAELATRHGVTVAGAEQP